MARLRDIASRLGKAWDEYRAERWRMAVRVADACRTGEPLEVAAKRIYLASMAHTLYRARRS